MKLSKRDKYLRELQKDGPFLFVPHGRPAGARSCEPDVDPRDSGEIYHVVRLNDERRPGIRQARKFIADAFRFDALTKEERSALIISAPETFVQLQRAKARVKKVTRNG